MALMDSDSLDLLLAEDNIPGIMDGVMNKGYPDESPAHFQCKGGGFGSNKFHPGSYVRSGELEMSLEKEKNPVRKWEVRKSKGILKA